MTSRTTNNKYIDLRLALLLAGFYLIFDIVLVLKMTYLSAYRESGSNENWMPHLLENLFFDYIIVVSYMILIAISTKRFLNKKYSWFKIISIHIIFSLFIGIVIRMVLDIYNILMGKSTLDEFDLKHSFFEFMFVVDLNFLIYFAMIFIIYTYFYVKEVKSAERKQRELENQLFSTKMKMLSSQLQPHFLFNTLNSISVLTDINPKKAKDTIVDLSDFLRETLYDNDSIYITLEKELRVLDYYLNILNIRFSDHLKIVKEVDESLMNQKVPSMLLQPLIENSVKHGYSYNHTDLNIIIRIYKEYNHIHFEVENDGEELTASQSKLMSKGVGLSNLKNRLEEIYGDDYRFTIENKPHGKGVISKMRIPT